MHLTAGGEASRSRRRCATQPPSVRKIACLSPSSSLHNANAQEPAPCSPEEARVQATLQPLLLVANAARHSHLACLHLFHLLALAMEQALGDRCVRLGKGTGCTQCKHQRFFASS